MPSHTIDIKFSRAGRDALLYSGTATYRSSSVSSDSVNIYKKRIQIRSARASGNNDLLASHNSTLHRQILKSICLYYLAEQKPNQIRMICLTRKKGNLPNQIIELPKSDIQQILGRKSDLQLLSQINLAEAASLLNETRVGRSVLYASTHLIKSLDTSNPFERFEKLWLAFNALYRAFANSSNDHVCQVALRGHIKNNSSLFPLSLSKVTNLTSSEIRSNIRWNQMILNNHPTQPRTTALRDSILRVSDFRILEIYQSTLSIRADYLSNLNLYTQVIAYIQNGIAANVKSDADLVSTLCIKYMYFVRNKIAHAEKADHGFSFLRGGAEEREICWLVPYLEALVVDLININSTF